MFEWAATLYSQASTTGAIDVVVIKDSNGNLSCSPFHVKLNKSAKRGDTDRVVKLAVNSKAVDLSMKLGGAGEAFFVERKREKVFKSRDVIQHDPEVILSSLALPVTTLPPEITTSVGSELRYNQNNLHFFIVNSLLIIFYCTFFLCTKSM